MHQRIDRLGSLRAGQSMQEIGHGSSGLFGVGLGQEGAEELWSEHASGGTESWRRPGDEGLSDVR